MSAKWEPGSHPVHGLIQLLDVCAAAFNRYRQRMITLELPTPPADWDQWMAGARATRAEYGIITRAVFPRADTAPYRTANRIALRCIAWLATKDMLHEEPSIRSACDILATFGAPLFPASYSHDPGSETARAFEKQGELIQAYWQVRNALFIILSRGAEMVPDDIFNRESLSVVYQGLPGVELPSNELLLGMIAETHAAGAATPPPITPPASTELPGPVVDQPDPNPVWVSRCGGALDCSPDYATVRRGNETFHLTPAQRDCVQFIIEAWERGRREFTNRALLDAAGSTADYVRDVFRSNGKTVAAWNTLLVEVDGKRGFYTLRLVG